MLKNVLVSRCILDEHIHDIHSPKAVVFCYSWAFKRLNQRKLLLQNAHVAKLSSSWMSVCLGLLFLTADAIEPHNL